MNINLELMKNSVDFFDCKIEGSPDEPMVVTMTGYYNPPQHTNCRCKLNNYSYNYHIPEIEKVIHNDPATVVYWKDGTKTVVKRYNEPYDAEKGLAMAICKKLFDKEYHKIIRKWTCENDKVREGGEME